MGADIVVHAFKPRRRKHVDLWKFWVSLVYRASPRLAREIPSQKR